MSAFNFGRSDSADGRDARSFAGRGVSLHADGSGARSHGAALAVARFRPGFSLVLAALLLVSLLALAITAGSAHAAKTTVRAIGTPATGATGGLFNQPRGVAINKTGNGGVPAGTFYVVDSGNRRLQRLSPTGAFVSAWGWGVSTGSAQYEVCGTEANCGAGLAGAGAGQFGFNGGQGIAVDQSNGMVYVSDQINRRIHAFSAAGVFQGAFGWGARDGIIAPELQFCTSATGCSPPAATAPATGNVPGGQFGAQLGGLAVDGAGTLYVANKTSRRIDVFSPLTSAGSVTGVEFVRTFGWGVLDGTAAFQVCNAPSVCRAPAAAGSQAGNFAANNPLDVAVDGSGNLFALDSSATTKRVQKFNPTPEPVTGAFGAAALTATFGTGNLYALAIDPADDHVYVAGSNSASSPVNQVRVAELDPTEAGVDVHGADIDRTSANGLAVAPATLGGNLYVSSSQFTHSVFVLNEPPLMSPVTNIAGTTATFEGEVVSNNFAVEYHFEHSADGGATWTKVPSSDVAVPAVPGNVAVSQEASGLVGSQDYEVRLVQNRPLGGGSATSDTVAFTTAAEAPVVSFTGISAVTATTAVLEADVNPQNQATTFHFEYGSEDCAVSACTSAPVPDGNVGSGNKASRVTHEVSGLAPDTEYHLRVVATNPSGTTEGPDRTFRTFAAPRDSTACSNRHFRIGASANLPDCRAYEMVSPLDKNGGDIRALGQVGFTTSELTAFKQAAPGGDRITYSAAKSFGDCVSAPWSSQYISTRGPNGWTTHCINPPRSPTNFFGTETTWGATNSFEAFTPDLSSAWFREANTEPLTGDALPGCVNLYRRDNLTDGFEALSKKIDPVTPASNMCPTPGEFSAQVRIRFQGYSTDLSHMVFMANGPLTADAAPGERYQLYDLHNGVLKLVSQLPDGSANTDSSYAGTFNSATSQRANNHDNAVSADGSRIFWTSHSAAPPALGNAAPGPGRIYARVDGNKTIPVSEAVSPEKARFWTAAADGSKAIFSFTSPPPPAPPIGLYEFDVDEALAGEPDPATLIAQQSVGIAGAADDLSHLYFVSSEALPGAGGAVAGQPNLYLRRGGSNTFITTLSGKDVPPGIGGTPQIASAVHTSPLLRTSRVTPDGKTLAFTSFASLTGYDNSDAETGEPVLEVYRFDADSEELTCVSCNPSGERPNGARILPPYTSYTLQSAPAGVFNPANPKQAAMLPTCEYSHYCSRVLTDDGKRVYFHTHEALVPRDTNGTQDVYQWQAEGSGDCDRAGGCIDLISTGKSPEISEFYDASANGDEVFFSTHAGIDPRDEGLIDVYVARVGGGFPLPPKTPECVGDACQTSPPPPGFNSPSSSTFSGPGNPVKGPDCRAAARRAKRLAIRAKRLRRAAKRAEAPVMARRMHRSAKRSAKQARALSKRAKRCRARNDRRANTNGRAGR